MRPLTCPIPDSINPLQSNGFMFNIAKLPAVSFFSQEVTLPNIELPPAEQYSSLVTNYMPGDKLQFGDLSIQFMIDSNMQNYTELFNWMISLGFPQDHEQYAKYLADNTTLLTSTPSTAAVSPATLQVLGPNGAAIKTINFIDLFPTSLQQLQLQSTSGDTTYLTCGASFRYTYFTLE